MEDEPVYYRNKVVGYIRGRTYVTFREPDHVFRIFKGFGISVSILNQLSLKGVKTVKIIYRGKTGESVLISDLNDWISKGYDWVFEEGGEKDPQKVLPIEAMEIEGIEVPEFDDEDSGFKPAIEMLPKQEPQQQTQKRTGTLADFFEI